MKDKLIKIGAVLAVIIGIYLYFKQRAYIGYFIAVLAIPYGAYGLFKPYKSAVGICQKRLCTHLFPPVGTFDHFAGSSGHFFPADYMDIFLKLHYFYWHC